MVHFESYVGFRYVVRLVASAQGWAEPTALAGDHRGRFGRLRRRAGGAERKERGLSKRIIATLSVVAILAALVALATSGPASGAEAKTLQNAASGRLKAPQIPVIGSLLVRVVGRGRGAVRS